MLQPEPNLSPRDLELLEGGLFAINQAHNEGKLTLKQWVRLSAEWRRRIIEEQDEMLGGDYAQDCLDS